MDPDMVRQQEEAEAASHLRAAKLHLQRTAQGGVVAPPIEERITLFAEVQDDRPADAPKVPAKPIGGWTPALYCTVLTGAGLAGGIMAGVKLQLVPWQSMGIGAAAGFLLGWQGAAGWLMRHGVPRGAAHRMPLLAAAMVLVVEMAAMLLANRFSTAPPSSDPDDATAIYALIIAGGAIAAYALALFRIRRAARR